MDAKNQQQFSKFNCSFKELFEPVLEEPTLICKRMFGGLSIYMHGKLMLMLAESHGDTSYRGKTFPYEIWNGVLLPSRKDRHEELLQHHPTLVPHPILASWLYLKSSNEQFEAICEDLLNKTLCNAPLYGVVPKKR